MSGNPAARPQRRSVRLGLHTPPGAADVTRPPASPHAETSFLESEPVTAIQLWRVGSSRRALRHQ